MLQNLDYIQNISWDVKGEWKSEEICNLAIEKVTKYWFSLRCLRLDKIANEDKVQSSRLKSLTLNMTQI